MRPQRKSDFRLRDKMTILHIRYILARDKRDFFGLAIRVVNQIFANGSFDTRGGRETRANVADEMQFVPGISSIASVTSGGYLGRTGGESKSPRASNS